MNARTGKFAVSFPRPLLQALERLRKAAGQSRSAFLQSLVRRRLKQQEEAQRLLRYEAGYRNRPETADEVAAAQSSARALLREEPWT